MARQIIDLPSMNGEDVAFDDLFVLRDKDTRTDKKLTFDALKEALGVASFVLQPELNGKFVIQKNDSGVSVVKQNKIGFKARKSVNQSTVSGGTVNFILEGIYYNFGSNYSASTGLFIAPINGVYRFSASAFTETATTGRTFFTSRGTHSGVGERGADTDSTAARRCKGEWEVYLNAGETFGVSLYTSAVNQMNHVDTWLSGLLVIDDYSS